MKVEINVLAPVNSNEENQVYVVSSRDECRDATDRSVFDLVVETGDVITMGCVIGRPAPKQIKDAEARAGEMVTTYALEGKAVGVGYLVNGSVFITTGSYWAIRSDLDVFPMERFERDGGAGYLAKVRGIAPELVAAIG